MGVSLTTVSRWETNKRSPRIEEIENLAKALDISADELLGDDIKLHYAEKNVQKTISESNISMSYWGGVVDNAQSLAETGDKGKIIHVAFMLKDALSSLLSKAGISETGVQNFYMNNWSNNKIMNSIFGQSAML